MYIVNGIVYGEDPNGLKKITKVKALDDMMMILTFESGEERIFDATILDGPAFEPLQNPDIFKAAELDHGVVTWMEGDIDCAPEFMYVHSYAYEHDIAI